MMLIFSFFGVNFSFSGGDFCFYGSDFRFLVFISLFWW